MQKPEEEDENLENGDSDLEEEEDVCDLGLSTEHFPHLLDTHLSSNDQFKTFGTAATFLTEGTEVTYFKLFAASANGDFIEVTRYLKALRKSDVSQLNPLHDSPAFGLNPLHVAKTIKVAEALLDAGIPIDSEGIHSQTALHTHYDNPRVVKYLLSRGASVDWKTKTNGSTPLQWAVAADKPQVVKELLSAGADVNYQNFVGNTALHLAVSIQVAKILVAHGAKTDIVNDCGNMPLEEAANRAIDDSHYQVAVYLLELSKKQYIFLNSNLEDENFELSRESTSAIEQYQDLQKQVSEEKQEIEESESAYQSDKVKHHRQKKMLSVKESVVIEDVQSRSKERWNKLKNAFITGKTAIKSRRNEYGSIKSYTKSSSLSSSAGSDEFFGAFFEMMVKRKPKLASKLLDKQRSFLYFENLNRVYRYNTGLLGTLPNSSSAVKQMIIDNQADLIAHPVVQFSLNIRWILFTREILFFEACTHAFWLFLIVLTTSTAPGEIKLVKAFQSTQILRNPFETSILVANIIVFIMNIRYICLHIIQAKISCVASGKNLRLHDILHCRNESFYLLTNLLLLISQILRCIPYAPSCLYIADICSALITWRLYYRFLGFFECFESIGVPMSIITNMVSRNIIYFLILFMLITGFSNSMYLLYQNDANNTTYGTFPVSFITLFFFLFNLDIQDIYTEPDSLKKFVSFFVLGAYMTLCVLVTFNVIVAVMTNTFERIINASRKEWLLQRAKLILFYEFYDITNSYEVFTVSSKTIAKALENFLDTEFYPAGNTKHHVKETVDGTVIIELPEEYIQECVNFRRSNSTPYRMFRYFLFYMWKKRIRKSKSFLWPEKRRDDSYERVDGISSFTSISDDKRKQKPVAQIGKFYNPGSSKNHSFLGDVQDCKSCERVVNLVEKLISEQRLLSKEVASLRRRVYPVEDN